MSDKVRKGERFIVNRPRRMVGVVGSGMFASTGSWVVNVPTIVEWDGERLVTVAEVGRPVDRNEDE